MPKQSQSLKGRHKNFLNFNAKNVILTIFSGIFIHFVFYWFWVLSTFLQHFTAMLNTLKLSDYCMVSMTVCYYLLKVVKIFVDNDDDDVNLNEQSDHVLTNQSITAPRVTFK